MSGRKQTTRQASLENDKLRAEIAALRTQNTELQDATEILKDAASKKKGLPKNSPMLLAIKGGVKLLWRTTKFVKGEVQELSFAGKVMENLDLGQDYDPTTAKGKAKITEWKHLYSRECGRYLKEHWSYVQSQLKVAANAWMDAHDGKLPKIGSILACMLRKVSTPEMEEIFEWYWDKYIPKGTGNATNWNAEKRYYSLISTSAPQNSPNKLYARSS